MGGGISLPQTTYNLFPGIAQDGQIDPTRFQDIVSMLADAALDSGMGVVTGATQTVANSVFLESCKLPAASGDVTGGAFKGIAVWQSAKEPTGYPPSAATAGHYAAKDSVPVMKKGRIWIFPQGDLVKDGPLYCIYQVASIGRFRGDNTNAALVPNAKVLVGNTASSGLPCLIELNGI